MVLGGHLRTLAQAAVPYPLGVVPKLGDALDPGAPQSRMRRARPGLTRTSHQWLPWIDCLKITRADPSSPRSTRVLHEPAKTWPGGPARTWQSRVPV